MAKEENVDEEVRVSMLERYARKNVLEYRKMCFIVWLVVFAMTGIVVAGGYFDFSTYTVYDWTIAQAESSERQDAYDDAVAISDFKTSGGSSASVPRTETAGFFTTVNYIFEWKDSDRDDDIFTAENIQSMCSAVNVITQNKDWKLYCPTQNGANGTNTICDLQSTDILSYFYGSLSDRESCVLLNQTQIDTGRDALANVTFFFDQTSEVLGTSAASPRTRTSIGMGGPLGADTTGGESFTLVLEDDTDPQWEYYLGFAEDLEKEFIEFFDINNVPFRSGYNDGSFEVGDLRIRFYSFTLDTLELDRLVASDLSLVMASVLFVFCCMVLHIRSAMISAVGVFSVLLSIPVALFFYRLVFFINYFNQIHVVTIFLILGIGADNVFVFADAWKQSRHLWYLVHDLSSRKEAQERNIYGTGELETEVLIHRLVYTIRRAASSVQNTMLTTVAAFLATGISPVIPVAAFGIFAAVTVSVNFGWIFLIQPSITVWHHYKYRAKKQVHADEDESETIDKEGKTEREIQEEIEEKEESNSRAYEVLFFTKLYIPFMLKSGKLSERFRVVPILALLFNLVLFLALGIQAFKLDVPNDIPGNYAAGHMFADFLDAYSDDFAGGGNDDFVLITYAFGIEGIDRDGFKKFDPNGFRGDVVFDEDFDIVSSANQLHFLSVCNDLRNLTCIPSGESKRLEGCTDAVNNLATIPDDIVCVLEFFYEYYQATVNNISISAIQSLGDTDPEHFVGALENFSLSQDVSPYLGFVNSEPKYIAIEYRATLLNNQPTRIKEPFFDFLYDFEDSKADEAPVGMKSTLQTTFDMIFLDTELGIVSGLFNGLGLSLPAAYLVLLYGTNNIYLATFAFLSIVGIVGCVLGSIYVIGWTLGVAEAIAAIMVVGLSVDYCVHLGHMYAVAGEEGHHKRSERFEIAAKRMGPTVLAGFITTGGSASVMFFCQLEFFNKMAALIVLTVFFSLEFALCFYLPVNLLFGPEGHSGVLYGKNSCIPCLKSLSCGSKEAKGEQKTDAAAATFV